MTITFRAVSYAVSAGQAVQDVEVSKPTGTVDGDVLVAFVRGYDAAAAPTISPPAGWTEIVQGAKSSVVQLGAFWKRASSEGSSYTFTHDGTDDESSYSIVYVLSYSGCIASGDPIDDYSDTNYTTNNTTLRAASVDTTGANAMLLALGYTETETLTCSWSGMTERLDSNMGSTIRGLAAEVLQASAGSSGNKDGTLSGSATGKHAYLIALRAPIAPSATNADLALASLVATGTLANVPPPRETSASVVLGTLASSADVIAGTSAPVLSGAQVGYTIVIGWN